MPADVYFIAERNVLFFTYTDPLTLAEIEASLNVYLPFFNQASTPVCSIFDVTGLTILPPKVLSTFIAKRMLYQSLAKHPRQGISVVVTSNAMVSSVAHVAAHAFSTQKVRVVRTLAHAWAEIDGLPISTKGG